ncbi:phage tail protein [Salmonella enterica]|uniref:Phage tail protein n=1 Tax=Salmonella enterica TaxID=28901 RepID=A0A626YJZ8_SALER|nr:phage tail protein [Salmonella enterica]EGH5043683.1 phage tail protein [Salmonella enterica]EGJ2033657.1 phage tail protein [Salmonella enterica]EGJ2057218.1 phage tail protein [Salmonella enterica]EJQ6133848.1 phage tail protein [Salmonella enterica]
MPASPKFKTIITDYGKQRLIAAMSPGGTKLTLTQMAVGDGGGNPTNPDTTSAALVNEVWRAAVNSVSVDKTHSNIIIVELLIPAEVGGFWIREAGIYDEFNKLVAVCSLPASEKPLLEQGSGRAQTVRMTLVISDMSTINITIDSTTIIATNDYVDNSLKEHEKSRNHPDATLTDKGFVKLYSGVTSMDETMAATPKAVKIAMDNASARLAKERNLADLTNIPLARQSLQLGNSATRNVGTTPGTVAAGDDSRITGAMQKDQNGADILDKPDFIKNVGLGETVDQAAGAMQKLQNGGDIPDRGLFAQNISAALAFSGGVAVGGDSNPWTTAEFIAWLESCGAFNHPYWMCKGSWDYAGNKVITDTGCGNICLAGAVIEVMGTRGAMTIRITTPTTTSGGGVASAQFTYINHGEGYAPGWRREFSRTGDEMTGNLYLKNDGRVNFCIMNEDGTPRMWIFKDKGSDGIHINNGNDGGGDFIFGKDGNFRAGAAIYANNGDAFGTAWGGGNAAWLSSYLYLNMVKAIRLGPVALSGGLWRDFQLGGGQVVTGFHTDGDWEMQGGDDKVYYRPIQYLIGTQWVTAPSV